MSVSVEAPASFKRSTDPLKSSKEETGQKEPVRDGARSALGAVAGVEKDISGVSSTFRRLYFTRHLTAAYY